MDSARKEIIKQLLPPEELLNSSLRQRLMVVLSDDKEKGRITQPLEETRDNAVSTLHSQGGRCCHSSALLQISRPLMRNLERINNALGRIPRNLVLVC